MNTSELYMSFPVLYSGFTSNNRLENDPGVNIQFIKYNDESKNIHDVDARVEQYEFR